MPYERKSVGCFGRITTWTFPRNPSRFIGPDNSIETEDESNQHLKVIGTTTMASQCSISSPNVFRVVGIGSLLVLLNVAYLSLRDSAELVRGIRHPAKVLPDQDTLGDDIDHSTKSDPWILPGKWVHVGSNRTFAAPVCCGWDKGEYKHHMQECGSQRSDQDFYRGPPATNGFYQQIGGNACRRESSKNDKFIDEWMWQAPDLPAFDAHATCRHLGNRTVLFLGDSTTQQTSTTLMNALKPGGCAPQIMLQLSDTLIHRELGNLNRGIYWIKAVKNLQPDIVIANAGAHVRTQFNYTRMLDEVIQVVHEWRNDARNKHVEFVWKTQQPGGCTPQIVHPEDPVRAAMEFNFSHTPRYELYEYNNFYQRDLYTMERWTNELDAHVLDLRMLYSRSDAHPGSGQVDPLDCLHFLAPGPLDVVAPVFQRLLVEIDAAH